MPSSLTPTFEQMIAVRRWGIVQCRGFTADTETLLLRNLASDTWQLWHRSTSTLAPSTLDTHHYAYCGTLSRYRGFIVLEKGDTFSQVHHWDVDGTLSPIMAPLPLGYSLHFLPGEDRAIFRDRQGQGFLISFPDGAVLSPLPSGTYGPVATQRLFTYLHEDHVRVHATVDGSLLGILPIPDYNDTSIYAQMLSTDERILFVVDSRSPQFVVYAWDLAELTARQLLPLAKQVFASEHFYRFGNFALSADSATLMLNTVMELPTGFQRRRWERWSLVTGQPLPCPQPPQFYDIVAVAPDHSTYLFAADSGMLNFWSADDPVDALTPAIQAHEDADQERWGLNSVMWSPDSRWVVTSGTNRRDELATLGYESDDDALVSDEFKQRQRPAHGIEDYVYTAKLWRIR